MKELFDMCDTDGDNQITESELRKVMDELQIHVQNDEFKRLFKSLDTNHDNLISFGDFLSGFQWVQKSIALSSSTHADEQETNGNDTNQEKEEIEKKQEKEEKQRPQRNTNNARPRRRLQRSNSIAQFIQKTSLSETQVFKMKEVFMELDSDGDSFITPKELWQFLERQGVTPAKKEFLEFFQQVDTTGRGKLEFREFVNGMIGLKKGFYICTEQRNQEQEEEESIEKLQKKIQNLEEKNEIMFNYLKEFVEKSVASATQSSTSHHYRTSKAILDILDYELVKNMEEFVGKLTTKEMDHNV
eukprot:CAMPEP_0174254386 /NCGR_PEP_ID=MMETSP0439-20130205/3721_1 /TAXON_ID=0 /ORGANISM="Stereomyxa ramosa, Strain Chinc5" /LENGTH=300 /DNA_ID=CAMNT_0015335945 /DNA_START=98 /DNA_END=997 /DNA_ORIENTATION=-